MTEVTAERETVEARAAVAVCVCESYARTTERAALAGARWLGRADEVAAHEAAASGMHEELELLAIDGHVVIGGAEESDPLPAGATVGRGGEPVDLAVDPLEGSGIVARGGSGAMTMIAAGEPGSIQTLPDMYMRKMAVGPLARGKIDLRRPVADNIQAIAEAYGRRVGDITTIVLDRPRHHDLIEEIRASGARIKLRRDSRHERPPRDRHRRHAPGRPGRRGAPLPRRRAAGAAVAGLAAGDRRGARAGRRGHRARLHDRRAGAEGRDRRRDGRFEQRPAAGRPLPRRQRLDAFPRHVHALQLGALRRRDPLLPARAPRGSSPTRVLTAGAPADLRGCHPPGLGRHLGGVLVDKGGHGVRVCTGQLTEHPAH
jgi:hypothetical protein